MFRALSVAVLGSLFVFQMTATAGEPTVSDRLDELTRAVDADPSMATSAALDLVKTRRLEVRLANRAASPAPPTNIGGHAWQAGFSAGWARGDKRGFYDRRHDKDYSPVHNVAVPGGHDANYRSGYIAGYHSGYIVGYSRGRKAPREVAAK